MREPTWFRSARVIVLILLGLFALLPVYVMLTTSVKPLADVQNAFRWFPSHLTLSPFVEMWQTIPLLLYLKNSLIVCTTA
jgi:multiple sugar transport system permease protein